VGITLTVQKPIVVLIQVETGFCKQINLCKKCGKRLEQSTSVVIHSWPPNARPEKCECLESDYDFQAATYETWWFCDFFDHITQSPANNKKNIGWDGENQPKTDEMCADDDETYHPGDQQNRHLGLISESIVDADWRRNTTLRLAPPILPVSPAAKALLHFWPASLPPKRDVTVTNRSVSCFSWDEEELVRKSWWKSWQSNKISTEKAARSPKFHHGDALASLASSGESDDGGLAPPPRKKQRTLEEATMQQAANGTVEQNGVSSTSNGGGEPSSSGLQNGSGGLASMTNGDGATNGNLNSPKIMDSTNHDIVRLIGQHLRTIGLKYVAHHFAIYWFIVLPLSAKLVSVPSFSDTFCESRTKPMTLLSRRRMRLITLIIFTRRLPGVIPMPVYTAWLEASAFYLRSLWNFLTNYLQLQSHAYLSKYAALALRRFVLCMHRHSNNSSSLNGSNHSWFSF